MDRRSLFFVVALAATYFFINSYFDVARDKKVAQEASNNQAAYSSGDLKGRLAPLSQFPLTPLYPSVESTEPLAHAVAVGPHFLTLSWDKELPSSVFIQQKSGRQQLQRCVFTPTIASPALYSAFCSSAAEIPQLPTSGRLDLQLLTLPAGNTPAETFLGEWSDGSFTLMASPLKQAAIAFLPTKNSLLPIGIYDPVEMHLHLLSDYSQLKPYFAFKTASSDLALDEKFYVLQNDYVQLVFSNIGAALAEINLPFQSAQNTSSVVLPIGFDRAMEKEHPYNDRFPSSPFYLPPSKPGQEPQFVQQGTNGGYYPLIRRKLIRDEKGAATRIPPRYYALGIISEFPEVANLPYTLKSFDDTQITFEANQPHRRITKTYSLLPAAENAPYCFSLKVTVEGDNRGLFLTSGVPEVELMSGNFTPILKYRITRKGKPEVNKIDLPKEKESINVASLRPDWVVNSNGYLGLIMDPLDAPSNGYRVQYVQGNTVPTKLTLIDAEAGRFKAADYPGYNLLLPLDPSLTSQEFRIFAGPFEDDILKAVDKRFSNAQEGYNPDYLACQTFFGWFSFISEPFAKFLYILMSFFHQLTGSWAASIVLLTVALRIMLFPLNSWSMKSMRRMQQLTPLVAEIQARYKKDPKRAQLEVMNLYRSKKVNPLSGCLPLIIQMPFLIGMFDLLKSTFELRGAPFIPGWIDNLTAPDVLFSWGYHLPFLGSEFHLLPFLLGGVMYLQQKISSTLPKDQSLWTDQQKQQNFMGKFMTIVFTVMFYNFPSGLNIYWLSSMLLGIFQQWWTNRSIKSAAVA